MTEAGKDADAVAVPLATARAFPPLPHHERERAAAFDSFAEGILLTGERTASSLLPLGTARARKRRDLLPEHIDAKMRPAAEISQRKVSSSEMFCRTRHRCELLPRGNIL